MDIDTDTVVAHVVDERSNTEIELVINRGLAAAALAGIPAGLKMMQEAGVPKNICLRVLNCKDRRRSSDWQ